MKVALLPCCDPVPITPLCPVQCELHSRSVHEAVAEVPKCLVPFPTPAPALGKLRCVAAEEPLPPVPVTERAGEGHGEAQGC